MTLTLTDESTTSYSRQKTLLRCPKKFEYAYVRKLRPKKSDHRFMVGSAVHQFLDVFYGSQTDPNTSKQQAFSKGLASFQDYVQEHFPKDEESEQHADLAEQIVHHYFTWAFKHDQFKVLGTEVPFTVDVSGVTFTGRFDGIVEQGGEYWILEHKTASQIQTEHVLRDKQISVYIWAARENGIPVSGVIYNTLKKAVPQKPKVLKSGKLSKSLNQNITYDTYMQAIKENDLDAEDYQDVLDQLAVKENPFFLREMVTRTDEALENTKQDIFQTEALKAAMVEANLFPRNDTKDCSWDCPFYDLCLAELEGADTSTLLAHNFIKGID